MFRNGWKREALIFPFSRSLKDRIQRQPRFASRIRTSPIWFVGSWKTLRSVIERRKSRLARRPEEYEASRETTNGDSASQSMMIPGNSTGHHARPRFEDYGIA